MKIKSLLINLGKLLFCGFVYFIGLIVGGIITSGLHLPQPPLPEGMSQSSAVMALPMVSPILAFALSLIARGINGGLVTRTLILSGFTYIAYTLNTVLEASLYITAYASTSAFMTISAIVPSLFCGFAVALLFPPKEKPQSFVTAWKAFFGQRKPGQWLWRLLFAGVAFMPVYIFFGFLVNPITGDYYRHSMFGLKAPGWDEILPVILVRSILFLLACLPISVTWQKSVRSLLLNLGTSLFILVGFIYLLMGYWLPLYMRIPHSVEILADSFVYAGVLIWLLTKRFSFSRVSTNL